MNNRLVMQTAHQVRFRREPVPKQDVPFCLLLQISQAPGLARMRLCPGCQVQFRWLVQVSGNWTRMSRLPAGAALVETGTAMRCILEGGVCGMKVSLLKNCRRDVVGSG